jgi:hypothetical protein
MRKSVTNCIYEMALLEIIVTQLQMKCAPVTANQSPYREAFQTSTLDMTATVESTAISRTLTAAGKQERPVVPQSGHMRKGQLPSEAICDRNFGMGVFSCTYGRRNGSAAGGPPSHAIARKTTNAQGHS